MMTAEKYMQLLQDFPPRPITSEADFAATQAVINRLLDKPELTPEEEDYLDVLGALVSEYENQQEDLIPDIYGVELLKVLIAEQNLKQKDLVSIFKTESIVSDVLNEKRQLTTRHIQELSEFFHFSPAVFFPNLK
ncbi:helix-turn-helix domain-containing protein [Planktothrix agardhii]|uniref:helix-turn-helix domain-containing protein n=1 Tax=Planktothrix agardhii TaxID=1160 RepID=UPI001D0BD845|nr:transcriptional regulator [Planktothrix agardhii]MCB8786089.1 transcriptional regulator [Planktothrix agardhii 1025]MCF3613975.1 transcriptional regulator [Planktothrix agardhii 1027]